MSNEWFFFLLDKQTVKDKKHISKFETSRKKQEHDKTIKNTDYFLQQNIFLKLKGEEKQTIKTAKQHKVQKVFKTTKHISKVETLSSSKNTFAPSWKESCDASHSVGRFYNEK